MNQEILGTVSTFAYEGGLDHASIDVGYSSNLGVFPPNAHKRVCNQYHRCVIIFHKCLFSLIGFHLLFNDFEINFINHMMVAPSQLYLVSWVFVKVL